MIEMISDRQAEFLHLHAIIESNAAAHMVDPRMEKPWIASFIVETEVYTFKYEVVSYLPLATFEIYSRRTNVKLK